MTWKTWKPALALGAVLAVSGAASADDRDTRQLTGGPASTTMTLGGKGTAEQAATEDNELARGYYHGGYHGGYGYRGGYGWGGGYRGYSVSYYRGGYGGYYGGYRGYYGGYRPAYYGGYYGSYYQPAYYYPTYPVYSSYYGGCGFSLGIGGNAVSLGVPAVPLGTVYSQPVTPASGQPMQPMAQPTAPGDGTFRYDGGPANPVPLPKADPQPIPPANPSSTYTDLPVSLKPKPVTTPYKYKAYGEK